jgi:hypothetical protein
MADALSSIPAAVLRNLADKLYEKRKNAALEVYPLPLLIFSIWGLSIMIKNLIFLILMI